MKLGVVLGGIAVLALVLFLTIRSANASDRRSSTPIKDPNASLYDIFGPVPVVPEVTDPTAQKTGGLNPTDLCKRAYGAGTASVDLGAAYAKVPAPVNAGVKTAYNAVGAINCGAVNLIEKGVSTVIVTPAKKVINLIGSIF